MRKSITAKLFILTLSSFLFFIALQLILQHTFLKDYYINAKVEILEKELYIASLELPAIFEDENNEGLDLFLEELEESTDTPVLLYREGTIENDHSDLIQQTHFIFQTLESDEQYTLFPRDNIFAAAFAELQPGDQVVVTGNIMDNNVIYMSQYSSKTEPLTLVQNTRFAPVKLTGTIVKKTMRQNANSDLDAILIHNAMSYLQDHKDVQEVDEKSFTHHGEAFVIVMHPIETEDDETLLFSLIPQEQIDNSLAILRQFTLYLLGAVLLLSILIALFFSRKVTKPIIQMNQTASYMAQMNFDKQLDIRSEDELGQLATNLNTLSITLNQTLKQLHQANTQMKEEIALERRSERLRKEYMLHFSHEMKTPLAIIRGMLEGLLDGIYDIKDSRYLSQLMSEIDEMEGKIKQILHVSKIEEVVTKQERSDFRLDALIEEIIANLQYLADKHEIHTSVKLYPFELQANKKNIEEVLVNLYLNAIQHSPNKSSVYIEMKPLTEGCYFTIQNTGVHLTEEEQTHIWKLFYRSDLSRTRIPTGTGIGLYLVKQILDQHTYEYGVKNTSSGLLFYIIFRSNKHTNTIT
ncbi:HAMP domain-containing protein [Hazenella sp. IB182353]|uniref:sensor histidine kinase n=1 Tax=Polycladospora coralii TaxID=2771432 RepID=UPI0017466AA2|nr:ATP-binding protein [Polycladospora coralii]MBS7529923.1 HAMP domain-containing protein [Polycladospora coralii]